MGVGFPLAPARVVVLVEYANGDRNAVELVDWTMTRSPAPISFGEIPDGDRFEVEGTMLRATAWHGDMPDRPEEPGREELEAPRGVIES